jgi:hypothetical protein
MGMLRCPCPPHALRFSARPEGWTNPIQAIAALGLGWGRAQRWPVWFPPVAAPAAQRLRGGACTAGCTRSCSDSRGLFERSALARSEFHRAPRKRCGAGLPRSAAQGSQTWGRLSLVPFFGETKKGTAPPGAHPGQPMHPASTAEQTTIAHPTPKPLTPALSPKGRGSEPRAAVVYGLTSRPRLTRQPCAVARDLVAHLGRSGAAQGAPRVQAAAQRSTSNTSFSMAG